jgi:hypothetical protein
VSVRRLGVALVIAIGLAVVMAQTAQAIAIECGLWSWPLCW